MIGTIGLEDLGDRARQVLEELMEVAHPELGRVLVVDCPSSEIDGSKTGSHSSIEMKTAVCTALYQELKPKGIHLVAQYCKHLSRVLVLEAEAAQAYGHGPMNVVPQLKVGGSFVTAAYATLEHPVAVEHIRAHAGINTGDTLISIHMKDVAVPVRIETKEIGSAHVVCARTRPKFIDGIRTRYDEGNI